MKEPERTIGLAPTAQRTAIRKMRVLELRELEKRRPVNVPHSRVIVKSMQHRWAQLNEPDFNELTEAEDETLRLDAEEFKNSLQDNRNGY